MTSCFVRLVDWKPKEIPHWYGSSQTEVFPALTMSERAGTQCAEGLWLSSDALHAAPLPQQLIQHHSPAVATFSDFFFPSIGMRTCASAIASNSGRSPSTSCPNITQTGKLGRHSNKSTASGRVSIAAI